MIACLTLPTFAISLERQQDPLLARRPFILEAHERVFAASEEVERHGILPGMPLREARARCPEATVRSAQPERYQEALLPLHTCLSDFAPAVELAEAGPTAACYLDLGPLSEAVVDQTARDLVRAARPVCPCPPTVGVASGRFPARVAATLAAPGATHRVPTGGERALLAPLAVGILPLEPELARRLRLLGLTTVGAFAALPAGAVLTQFGREGRRLHRLAQGHDDSPIRPYRPREGEQAVYHFDDPVGDRVILEAVLEALATQLADGLRQRRMAAGTVWLKLRLDGHARCERRRHLPQPVVGGVGLHRALCALLQQINVRAGVVTVQAEVTALVPWEQAAYQPTLFGPETSGSRLLDALPELLDRFGSEALFQALPHEVDAPLPDWRYRLEQVQAA